MPWYDLLTFGVVYFVAVATPGPGVAAVIAQGLARGTQGAAAFIAGFVLGDLIWFSAASLGLSALAQSARGAFVAVRYLGAAYLLFLAYKLWSKPLTPLKEPVATDAGQRPSRLFLGSLTLTVGNPKPMVFFVALLPTVVPLETLRPGGYAEIAAVIAVILPSVLFAYVAIAARVRRWFTNPRSVRILNRGSGTLMAAAAAAVAAR
jgi:threonine/homoserine/homoserine lactone efflux protein